MKQPLSMATDFKNNNKTNHFIKLWALFLNDAEHFDLELKHTSPQKWFVIISKLTLEGKKHVNKNQNSRHYKSKVIYDSWWCSVFYQCFLSCYPQNNKKGLGVLNQEFEDSF